MSIVESLRKLVDPVEARRIEEERKTERELPKRDADGDPPRFACRVCGTEDEQGAYCPQCLAGTMRRLPRAKKTGGGSSTEG